MAETYCIADFRLSYQSPCPPLRRHNGSCYWARSGWSLPRAEGPLTPQWWWCHERALGLAVWSVGAAEIPLTGRGLRTPPCQERWTLLVRTSVREVTVARSGLDTVRFSSESPVSMNSPPP